MHLGTGFVVSEVLILIEMITYPILLMRTAQYHSGIIKLQSAQVWRNFYREGFITYILALIPTNLVFGIINPHIPYWVEGVLRLNRVLLITRVSNQIAFFGSRYPQATRILTTLAPTFYLVFVSHFISCLFNWSLLVRRYILNSILQ